MYTRRLPMRSTLVQPAFSLLPAPPPPDCKLQLNKERTLVQSLAGLLLSHREHREQRLRRAITLTCVCVGLISAAPGVDALFVLTGGWRAPRRSGGQNDSPGNAASGASVPRARYASGAELQTIEV